MNPPKVLFVGHLVFKIQFGDSALMQEAKAHGILDDVRLTITLNAELDSRLLAETAVHESLHALYAAYAFGNEALEEEELVSRLAGPLLKLQQDNSEFFEWINWLMRGAPKSDGYVLHPTAEQIKDARRVGV